MNGEIRRVVTTHASDGKAITLCDTAKPLTQINPDLAVRTCLLWVTDATPAEMTGPEDRSERTIGIAPPSNGSIFRIVDFPPESKEKELPPGYMASRLSMGHGKTRAWPARHPFTHRTPSIDYAIILSGETDMLLDDSEVHLKVGDVLVQQGTNHAWVNRGSEPCRIAFVLIDGVDPLV